MIGSRVQYAACSCIVSCWCAMRRRKVVDDVVRSRSTPWTPVRIAQVPVAVVALKVNFSREFNEFAYKILCIVGRSRSR